MLVASLCRSALCICAFMCVCMRTLDTGKIPEMAVPVMLGICPYCAGVGVQHCWDKLNI